MSKIVNLLLKNKEITTSFGNFKFDADGIVDVSDDQAKKLLSIKGFTVPKNEQKVVLEQKAEPMVDTTSDKENKSEDLSKLNIMQLKKIAKERGIDLGSANKKDEILALLED